MSAEPKSKAEELQARKDIAAKNALNAILVRIRDEREVQHLLGAGTETYGLLTYAAALLFDRPVDEVRDKFIPGSSVLYRGGDDL